MVSHLHALRSLAGAALLAALLAFPGTRTAAELTAKDTQDVPAAGVPKPAAAAGEHIDRLPLERLKRARMKVQKSGTFSAKSWYVPTPTPKPAPTPAPTAPPLPFTYLGKIQEAQGQPTYFLSDGNQVRLVSVGETLNNIYTVDGVEDGRLAITYLPLHVKQYLNVGDPP
jgi:hypothetical protein